MAPLLQAKRRQLLILLLISFCGAYVSFYIIINNYFVYAYHMFGNVPGLASSIVSYFLTSGYLLYILSNNLLALNWSWLKSMFTNIVLQILFLLIGILVYNITFIVPSEILEIGAFTFIISIILFYFFEVSVFKRLAKKFMQNNDEKRARVYARTFVFGNILIATLYIGLYWGAQAIADSFMGDIEVRQPWLFL